LTHIVMAARSVSSAAATGRHSTLLKE